MWFLSLIAVLTVVGVSYAQTGLPPELDPGCARIDQQQWMSFEQSELIQDEVFRALGISPDQPNTEMVFENGLSYSYSCAEGWNAVFEPAVELQCHPTTVDLVDTSNNAPGTATINVQNGIMSSTAITDTTAVTWGGTISTMLSIGIPIVGSGKLSVTVNGQHTKTRGLTTTYQTNTLAWVQRTINIGSGNSNCTATMNVITCQHEAKGKYPIIAVGWVGWRFKDEHVFDGMKARTWYVFLDSLPRATRLGWAELHAGISSQTYTTVLSECDNSNPSTSKQNVRKARPARLVSDWYAREEASADARRMESIEEKFSRAKAAVPDHLRSKIMRIGSILILAAED